VEGVNPRGRKPGDTRLWKKRLSELQPNRHTKWRKSIKDIV